MPHPRDRHFSHHDGPAGSMGWGSALAIDAALRRAGWLATIHRYRHPEGGSFYGVTGHDRRGYRGHWESVAAFERTFGA